MVPVQFLQEFKRAGFAVSNEPEFVERLDLARSWQAALVTLMRSGDRLGISFHRTKHARLSIHRLAVKLGLLPAVEQALTAIHPG